VKLPCRIACVATTAAMRLLLIEDHRDIAANIAEYFEARGDNVEHALDGEAGLQMALATACDAIVLDIMLPKLDGLSLCRACSASPTCASTWTRWRPSATASGSS
jgi:DNA-binding response OmpR family regulator